MQYYRPCLQIFLVIATATMALTQDYDETENISTEDNLNYSEEYLQTNQDPDPGINNLQQQDFYEYEDTNSALDDDNITDDSHETGNENLHKFLPRSILHFFPEDEITNAQDEDTESNNGTDSDFTTDFTTLQNKMQDSFNQFNKTFKRYRKNALNTTQHLTQRVEKLESEQEKDNKMTEKRKPKIASLSRMTQQNKEVLERLDSTMVLINSTFLQNLEHEKQEFKKLTEQLQSMLAESNVKLQKEQENRSTILDKQLYNLSKLIAQDRSEFRNEIDGLKANMSHVMRDLQNASVRPRTLQLIEPTPSHSLVQLQSIREQEAIGFVESSNCGEIINLSGGRKGRISFKTSGSHTTKDRCLWTIRARDSNNIKFTLIRTGLLVDATNKLHISGFTRGSSDSLEAAFHSKRTLETVGQSAVTDGSVAVVFFISNPINPWTGFVLEFEGNGAGNFDSVDSQDFMLSGFSGSADFVYNNAELATLVFRPPLDTWPHGNLTISLTAKGRAALEAPCYDFVNIFQSKHIGEGFKFRERLCSKDISPIFKLSTELTTIMVFNSDTSGIASGFKIKWNWVV